MVSAQKCSEAALTGLVRDFDLWSVSRGEFIHQDHLGRKGQQLSSQRLKQQSGDLSAPLTGINRLGWAIRDSWIQAHNTVGGTQSPSLHPWLYFLMKGLHSQGCCPHVVAGWPTLCHSKRQCFSLVPRPVPWRSLITLAPVVPIPEPVARH